MGRRDWKERAEGLKREAYALYLCSRHPETPLRAKVLALLIVGYAMSPIDLIPDFIPVLGYVDDLVLLPLGIAVLIKIMPKEVLDECRLQARSLPEGSSAARIGVFIIICLWAAAVYLAYRLIKLLF